MNQPRSTDLQPWPLAVAAFSRVWQERDNLLRLATVPVLVVFTFEAWSRKASNAVSAAATQGQQPDPQAAAMMVLLIFLGLLATLIFTTNFFTNWMRTLMFGDDAVKGLGLTFSKRHWRMLGMWLGLQIIMGVLLALLLIFLVTLNVLESIAIMAAAMLMFALLNAIVLARLSPVFVGIAIDSPMKVDDALKRTRGTGTRLAIAIVIVVLIFLAPLTSFYKLSFELGAITLAPLAFSFISVGVQFIMFAVVGAVFVLAYPRFVSETV